jgi:hypothetical protein
MIVAPLIVKVEDEGVKRWMDERSVVLLPTIRLPEGSRLIGIEETEMPAPPAVRAVLSIARPDGFAVRVTPLIVKVEDGPKVCWIGGRRVVLLPTSLFNGARVVGVPETVIAEPPATREVSSIARPEGLVVKVASLNAKVADAGEDWWAKDSTVVLVPTTSSSDDPRLTNVPDIMMGEPPVITFVPVSESPEGSIAKVVPLTVSKDNEFLMG